MSTEEKEKLDENKQEEIPQTEPGNEIPLDDTGKLIEAEKKLAEINDKYIRLYSEFDNFKKRTLKERIELIHSAGEDVFKLILPLLDDFERAIKANETAKDINAVTEGVKLVQQKFLNSLTSRGMEEMKALGEEFNSDLHEAITNLPAATEDMKGKVVEVVEKGYLLNGKVIRFAKVIVGI